MKHVVEEFADGRWQRVGESQDAISQLRVTPWNA